MTKRDLTRRQFVALGTLALAGCATSEPEPAAEPTTEETIEPEPTTELEPTPAESAGNTGTLVLVFSRAGENYNVGVVERGNTAIIADILVERTGADLFELEPAVAYPEDYDECCDVALAEQDEGARPELESIPDLAAYDTIYLGYPIWWGDLPMFMYTLLEQGDFAGKTIYPFCTHEGSGLSGTPASIVEACPDATVGDGMDLRGKTAQESPDEVKSAVADWLASL